MKLLVKTPKFVPWIYPKRIWAFSRNEPSIYLTFDDGPIPEVTPWVLETLKKFKAKATFFCIGDNIKKHPHIFKSLLDGGHSVGNHTFHHVKGTKTNLTTYLEEVALCESYLNSASEKLFRPPYGQMTSQQAKALLKQGYKIIMWDIISFDWDQRISKEACLQNVIKHLQPGSIVVFHDSIKAEKNLRYALPKVLETIEVKGWNCATLTA